MNIDTTDKEKIIKLAKQVNPEMKVYQMIPDTSSFNLIATKEEEII